MCIPTERELEFLASLPMKWRRLYWREFARVLAEDARPARVHASRAPRLIRSPSRDLRDWPVS